MSRFLPKGYELPFTVQGQQEAVVLSCRDGKWTATVQVAARSASAQDAATLLVHVLRDLADVIEAEAPALDDQR